MNLTWHHRWRWFTSLLVLAVLQRLAPSARAEDPAWLRLNGLPEPRVGLDVDASQETTRVNGVTSDYNTLFITPTVGLHTSGSIYHPNLLYFDLDGELGWGWSQMTTTGPGYSQALNESDRLDRYLFQVNLLQEKPYNASFYAAQDHTYRDYGSFDTFQVDSSRYGGNVVWHTDTLSLSTDFGVRDETDTGLTDSSEVKESFVDFLGVHQRKTGQTTITARWDQYDDLLNLVDLTSLTESVGVSDAETFGDHRQISVATGASVGHAEFGSEQTDTVNATENINVTHSPNLSSYLLFDFNQSHFQPTTDSSVQGNCGLRHQLYESLTSTLDLHGNYQDNTDGASKANSDLFGVGLTENYAKRLQSWGRLSAGASVLVDHQDQSFSATVIDEAHQLYLTTSASYRPVYLNQPDVTSIQQVTTANGQPLVEGSDYTVVPSGELTEIRLIAPAGPHLQPLLGTNDNLSVLVTYQSATAPNVSYESLAASFSIRLDLKGGLGIYGRLNQMDNDAPPTALTQTMTDLVGGADYTWRWLRAGAEYEDYDSNFSQYDALRFFQNASFTLDRRSTLAVMMNESFYHYPHSADQTFYLFSTRYNVQLWSSLSCYVQGGCSWQEIDGSQQLDGSAQAGFSWSRGRLSLRVGYEYNTESISTGGLSQEDSDKQRVFAYLRRTF